MTDDRRVLVLRRSEYKERPEKSHTPDLPGGIVDPGESERDAAVRELYEETGIRIDPNTATLGYSDTMFAEDEHKSVTKLLYLARISTTPDVTLSWEHEAHEWCDADMLLDAYEFRTFYRDGIAYMLAHTLI